MSQIKVKTFPVPKEESPIQQEKPLYMDGPERNQQANQQAMSQINKLFDEDRSASPKPATLPAEANIKQVSYGHHQEPDNDDYFCAIPKVPANAFPPDLQSAVDAACLGTEAHPMAVALHYAVYFAAHIGQQRYIRIGNDKHSLDLYAILAGRTGKVKGTAEAQANYINRMATTYLQEKYGYIPPRRLSGLSSGEGLIQSIKDPENEEDEKYVLDKRLLVIESEYANVLTQDQRVGNTLSMVLRDAFDGKTLSNITVTPRMATSPHISIIGHITPGELIGHKAFLSQSRNGALNRNLIFFAKRGQRESFPRQYTLEEAEALSQWFAEIIYRARNKSISDNYMNKNSGLEIVMSPDAKAVIEEEYHPREKAQDAMPELLANMVSRHRVFVWRLSSILALMDGSDVVQAEHVQQSYLWLDYSIGSIRYLLNTTRQEVEQEKVVGLAEEIYEFLLNHNEGRGSTTTDISRVLFSGNKKSADITAALKSLTESTPPKIEQLQPEKKGKGKRVTIYRPLITN